MVKRDVWLALSPLERRQHEVSVQHNWNVVKQSIERACAKSHRLADDIQVVAVTKYVDIERMEEALNVGLNHIGESKAQDALDKWDVLQNKATWHFIGHLQSNKVKYIIDKFDYIHSLDRLSLAKEIDKRAKAINRKINCFVQVNVSGEESKHGLDPQNVHEFITKLAQYEHINVIGLMTMAPYVDDPEQVRPVFKKLKQLQLELQKNVWAHAPLEHLSMGMSNDFEVAIEEGATFIRLGSCLVGD